MKEWKVIRINGKKLIQERRNIWMTQSELAERADMKRQGLYKIEKTWVTTEWTLRRLIIILNIPVKRGRFITKRLKHLTINDLQIWKTK